MSSMLRSSTILMLFTAACVSAPAYCNDGREWDQARARHSASRDATMAQAVSRWKLLIGSERYSFNEYAGFLLTYPGFPQENTLRTFAERALDRESPQASAITAYFEKLPPLTNAGRAHYALALAAQGRSNAREMAVEAWRGGPMNDSSEAAISYRYADALNADDHDARMNALLWAGANQQAARQMSRVSPAKRQLFMERLNMLQGNAPGSLGLPISGEMLRDAGYVYNRVNQLRRSGNMRSAVQLLATRSPATKPPLDPEKWIAELLAVARSADANSAVRIAASIDDAFPPGTDVSNQSYRTRDDYTSLMWLGGTKALWTLGDGARAAPLFYRYGAAAKTPPTRSKGFYWAGRAAAKANDQTNAQRYFEMAAQYPDHFYGLLALERLRRPLPDYRTNPSRSPSSGQRAEFMARPLTRAVREVAREGEWRTTVQFFRQIAEQAKTEADYSLVADLARELGRRDLAVILGQAAHADGHSTFLEVSFPLVPVPSGSDWTMVHAITRQESQFSQNAISHAGARGLMQLMPGTAREQAGKMGLSYNPSSLISDPTYNIRLGYGYFARMMDYYGGSYPLAVAAYNAGPGNVNKWLRANGDPRTGAVDWIDWIERIPIYETKNYVHKVLENAVVYEAMHPDRVRPKGQTPLSRFLGKRNPG